MTSPDAIAELGARVGRLEIRIELGRLVARYGHALDTKDWDAAAQCFADDGELTIGGTTSGRGEIKDLLATSLGRYEFTFHYPHSQIFDIADDRHAHGLVTAHAEHGLDGTCMLAGLRYEDEYVDQGGHWRFARREVDIRYLLAWPELGHAFHEGVVSGA